MKKILVVLTIIFAFFLSLGIGAEDKKEFNFEFFNYFHDDSLMENLLKAQENNLDLKIANIKLKESEKIVKLSLSQELPEVDFNGVISQTFSSSDIMRGRNNYMVKSYNQSRFLLPINVSYEVDLWGKNRLKTKAKNQILKMVEQDKTTTKILLSSSLASDYFNLIKTDKMLEIEFQLLELAKQYYNLTLNSENIGLSTKNDILSSQEKIAAIKAKISNLETKQQVLENQISYLAGDKMFEKIKRSSFDDLIELNNIPCELNSSIILNRPDVISSSENIIRASYDAKIAKKDLLPSFVIGGTFGFSGYNNLKGIFADHTGLAEIFVAPNLNIFDGARKFQMVGLKKLELEEAKKEYEKTVIASIQEVNDSLAVLKNESKNYELSKYVLDIETQKTNLKLINKRFGLANNLEYIAYKQAQLLAQEKLVGDKINLFIAYINLYRATGGADFNKEIL